MLKMVYSRRAFSTMAAGIATILATPPGIASAGTPQEVSAGLWEGLKTEIFGNRAIQTGTGLIQVVAPKRAQDAGLVPVDIEIDPSKLQVAVKSITLVIDVNPSPLAAVFKLGESSGVQKISTRVRVNDYSYIRAIAETAAGELHMAETFVKASGGCAAPAVKNPDEAKSTMGVMKLRQFPPEEKVSSSMRREMQLMIRHPNNSGFQMDQVTRYFIPPHFVQKLKVSQNGVMMLQMEGGISISEDPNFRFDYIAQSGGEIEVEATDTKGLVFHDRWPVESTGL
jgi:sulfur-oxidizing protein SoxY